MLAGFCDFLRLNRLLRSSLVLLGRASGRQSPRRFFMEKAFFHQEMCACGGLLHFLPDARLLHFLRANHPAFKLYAKSPFDMPRILLSIAAAIAAAGAALSFSRAARARRPTPTTSGSGFRRSPGFRLRRLRNPPRAAPRGERLCASQPQRPDHRAHGGRTTPKASAHRHHRRARLVR